MRKLKLLFAACALILGAGQAWAQTDVTSTYITNADFSSTGGWTEYVSGSFKSYGNGFIGTYGVRTDEGQAVSTADDTHLATEHCFGFECRWSGNYASYNQTTSELPVGAYTLTFDVEDTNPNTTKATYNNLFYVQVGETKYTDSSTEWMNKGKSSWTTHTISFNITQASTAIISLGYGTGSNNIGSANTPTLHVSHLKLTWTDPLKAAKDALQAEIDKASLCDAKEGLAGAIATAEGVLTSATTVAELEEALADLQAADKDAVLRYENGLADATATAPVVTDFVINGTFDNSDISMWTCTGGFQNKGRKTTDDSNAGNMNSIKPWWENWNPSALVNKMSQTIDNIPNGTYRLDITAFVNNFNAESQYVFANSDQTPLTEAAKSGASYEVYTVVTNNKIEVGLEQTAATANWMGIDNVSLRYYGAGDVISQAQNASHKLAWEEAKAAAEAALADDAYTNVIGSEKTALQTEIAKAEPSTAEGYDAAAEALTSATSAFTSAKGVYDAYAEIKGVAEALNVNIGDAPANADAATATTHALNVAVYNVAAEQHDVTDLYAPSWSNMSTSSGQHWSGDTSISYADEWRGDTNPTTRTATITLPEGKYILMSAGRGSDNTVTTMSANEATVTFASNGDVGIGINKDGAASFDSEDAAGFSNKSGNAENTGTGWEWRYIPVTLTAETEITVTQTLTRLSGSAWGSFSDFRILCDDATYAPIALDEAKAELNATIENAPAALSANIGDGAFQIPAAGVNTYSDALAAAQAVYDATDATVASIEQAKTDLEAAIEAYNALEVNAPADGQLFSVSLANGSWTYTSNNVTYTLDKEAMTYMAGDRNDMGGYNIKYTAEANTNLAQAFTFTKVEGNDYKMSQIDAEGNVRYMCTGVPYSGNTSQIRTTINADEAMRVTVIPTETEGVWNLKNVAANNYIGAQDAGVFTVNSHINFNIVETTKPSIAINTTAAGWGTVILPFAVAELPEGVNAYSCAEVDGSTLTLVAVTALEANKPYIIEGAWNETLTGDAQGTALTYTEGLLTGVYADTPAPAGEFVLQNNNNKVAFYEVEDGEGKQPTVGANRCYLTWEEAGVRALFFPGKETTGIDAINALVNGNATIYNASGAQIPALQKGMNIIKTKNGGTRKVMVK